MAVMAPREKWTDDRLDDLNKKVDDGFARVEGDIRELRVEVKKQGESLRAEMSARLGETETRLEKKIDDGIGRLKRDNSSLKRIIYAAVAAVILSQIADISPL